MSEPVIDTNTLLIDIGNSRIKVAQLSSPAELYFVCTSLVQLCDWLNSQDVTRIYCANVRHAEKVAPLAKQCQDKHIELHFIETEKQHAGLSNSYTNVANMGVDRWLAMQACMAFAQPHFAVLMFGTAITCDIVSLGKHQGGWIIPGRSLMHSVLTTNTARVFTDKTHADSLSLGQSTPDCVDTGCFAAALGVVTMAEQYLSAHFEQYCIYLSGGDNKVLTALKGDAIFRAENLVLQGLARYAMPF